MRYLGSKTLLTQQIFELVGPYERGAVFCDPFGGIGTVGSYMKQQGFRVISGDLLQFAHCFQKALIQMNEIPSFRNVIEAEHIYVGMEKYLNSLIADTGWLVEEYSNKRKFFTIDNAKHIQGCINAIWDWRLENRIDEDEYAFLIASLINSTDKVANTAGTYYAYLKEYGRKARRPFCFRFLQPYKGDFSCDCVLEDANSLVSRQNCQILYLDPPYNERDYAGYYHLPETIARGNVPNATGKSGISVRSGERSAYITKARVMAAFSDLIDRCHCDMILFHYTDQGLLKEEFVRAILSEKGKIEEHYFNCKGYRTSKSDQTMHSQHHVYKVVL